MLTSSFKWVGNKRTLLPLLTPLFPTFTQAVEPFFGSGAFSLNQKTPVIGSDICEPLIELHKLIQTNPVRLLNTYNQICEQYDKNPKETFYKIRKFYNNTKRPDLLFFLIKHTYRGVYDTNQKGGFNRPHDKSKLTHTELSKEGLQGHYRGLQNVSLEVSDFYRTSVFAKPDTFYFIDPPYKGKGFYDQGLNELRLIQFLKTLDKKSSPFLVTLSHKLALPLNVVEINSFNSLKNKPYTTYVHTNYTT